MSFVHKLKGVEPPIEEVVKINYQQVTNQFLRALDKFEEENGDDSREMTKVSFAPSGVGYGSGRCPRRWHYAFNGVHFDRRSDAVSLRNMDNGTYRHHYLEKMLQEWDHAIAVEEEFWYEDPPIHGFIDAIVEWEGLPWIMEFKTTTDEWYDYRRTELRPPFYNLLQILIYMKVKDIPRGMIVYENKNTFRRTGIAVEWDDRYEEYMEKVFDWMRLVYKTTKEEGKLPERNFSKKSNECKYCPVREACYSDDREADLKMKSLPKTKV